MSRKLHQDAKLEGFFGPRLDIPTGDFQDSLEGTGFNGLILDKAAHRTKVDGYGLQEITRPITSDGYGWFWACSFRAPSGIVNILIPWNQDWRKVDGSQSDRAIAVYAEYPEFPASEASLLIVALMAEIRIALVEQRTSSLVLD